MLPSLNKIVMLVCMVSVLSACWQDPVNVAVEDAWFQKNSNDYHLIFSDPPFKYPFLQQMVNQVFVNDHLVRNGLVVLHHEIDNPLNEDNVPYKLLKQKKIGRSILSFITKEATDD